MLLKSLELQGFKTFPDKTKLTFNEGMTGIVGPNGSGKSNISDAIRWVLGEQSPTTLRCKKMEDVVFDGTNKRKKLGYAEVTLTFDNKDRVLPFDGDEVAITRRYFRSGESEYLINKASVRLKDIHSLFMDTGLGRDGYSMIGQGKIDAIVSSKSEDRREIFEEAAGISRYRYRKEEAERKLVHTEENLVRLRDIVKELEDRVGPLETQSKKATLFLEYSGEKKGLEIALWLDTLQKSSSTLRDQEDKIDIAKTQYQEVNNQIKSYDNEINEIYDLKANCQTEIEKIRTNIDQLTGDISDKRSSVNVAKNDIEHNNENITRLNNEIELTNSSTQDLQKDIDEKEAQILNLTEVINKNQKDYDLTAEKLLNINTDSSRSSEEIQNISTEIASLTQKQADARVIVSTSATTISELESRISNLKDNLDVKNNQYNDTKSISEEYKVNIEKCNDNIISLNNSIDGLEIKLDNLSKKKDEQKSKFDELSLDANEKVRKANILKDLARNYEGYYESVKTVMKDANSGSLHGIRGPISQLISVPEKYNVAIEVALGNKMQNIVTENDEDAKRAIEMLKKNKAGRATFLPVQTIKPRVLEAPGIENCIGYIGVADTVCTFDSKYTNVVSQLLGQIVIVEDLQAAMKIAKQYNYKFKVVTLDGQIVNTGGSFTGGSSAKKSGLLSRESDIKKLFEESNQLKNEAQKINSDYQETEKSFGKVEADLFGSRADLSNLKQELVRLETEFSACENEINSLSSDIENIQSEISTSLNKIDESKNQMLDAQKSLDEYTEKINEDEIRMSELSGSQEKLSQEREALSSSLQELKLFVVSFTKDIETLNSEIETAKLATKDKESLISDLNNQINSYKESNNLLDSKIKSLEQEISAIQEEISLANNNINECNKSIDDYDTRVSEISKSTKDILEQRENLSNEVSRLEERKINIQKEKDDIILKLWEEYELTERGAKEEAIEIEDYSTAKARLAELKSKIKALGNVNVGAIEEYKEVSERYSDMKVQVDDVEKAKKEIEDMIKDLTKQMQDVFVESFYEINKNFDSTFKELFGGGDAKLELTEPEEILTSGIDIIVHPPGKVVKRLESLSGGEKALVAIALYFSIMKVRPAPFCVMDEIEAALDEVNVDRFADYVKRLCDNTQFILITHRRGTMEEADVLYGVTMQDEGISKLLELKATEVASKLGFKAN